MNVKFLASYHVPMQNNQSDLFNLRFAFTIRSSCTTISWTNVHIFPCWLVASHKYRPESSSFRFNILKEHLPSRYCNSYLSSSSLMIVPSFDHSTSIPLLRLIWKLSSQLRMERWNQCLEVNVLDTILVVSSRNPKITGPLKSSPHYPDLLPVLYTIWVAIFHREIQVLQIA